MLGGITERLRRPIGATYAVNSPSGGTEIKRDYKKALIDASIIAGVTATSVLAGFGFPPGPEALYACGIAFLLGILTSLAKRFDIEVIED